MTKTRFRFLALNSAFNIQHSTLPCPFPFAASCPAAAGKLRVKPLPVRPWVAPPLPSFSQGPENVVDEVVEAEGAVFGEET